MERDLRTLKVRAWSSGTVLGGGVEGTDGDSGPWEDEEFGRGWLVGGGLTT
jgi:hypothetical protein